MPFIKLMDSHRCIPPKDRDDGSVLIVGDEWECVERILDGTDRVCTKQYRWTSDQREGLFWMPINYE